MEPNVLFSAINNQVDLQTNFAHPSQNPPKKKKNSRAKNLNRHDCVRVFLVFFLQIGADEI